MNRLATAGLLCLLAPVYLLLGGIQADGHCDAADNGFVTTDTCNASKEHCIGCFKAFPINAMSVYERMECTNKTELEIMSNGNLTCPNPCDDFCWVSCEVVALYDSSAGPCDCTPHTGGDGDGNVPNWCHAPQGQMAFFTECYDSSAIYTCSETAEMFTNALNITMSMYEARENYSCSGNFAEETIRRCLSTALATFVRNNTAECEEVSLDAIDCFSAFRDTISSDAACNETSVALEMADEFISPGYAEDLYDNFPDFGSDLMSCLENLY